MTVKELERELRPLGMPVEEGLLRWLYLNLPPQPIKTRQMHRRYSKAIGVLMEEHLGGTLDRAGRTAVRKYLSAVLPFVERYEKKAFG